MRCFYSQDNGALVVMGQGMGSHKVVPLLAKRLLPGNRPSEDNVNQDGTTEATDPGDNGTILVLGLTDWQRDLLLGEMGRHECPVHEVTAEVPSADRERLYRAGSVIMITFRILVVDILRKARPRNCARSHLHYGTARGNPSPFHIYVTCRSSILRWCAQLLF